MSTSTKGDEREVTEFKVIWGCEIVRSPYDKVLGFVQPSEEDVIRDTQLPQDAGEGADDA
jgi:hypothetical protein